MEIPSATPVPSREIGFLYQEIQLFNENIFKFINVKLRKGASKKQMP